MKICKQILAVFLAAICCFSLFACGSTPVISDDADLTAQAENIPAAEDKTDVSETGQMPNAAEDTEDIETEKDADTSEKEPLQKDISVDVEVEGQTDTSIPLPKKNDDVPKVRNPLDELFFRVFSDNYLPCTVEYATALEGDEAYQRLIRGELYEYGWRPSHLMGAYDNLTADQVKAMYDRIGNVKIPIIEADAYYPFVDYMRNEGSSYPYGNGYHIVYYSVGWTNDVEFHVKPEDEVNLEAYLKNSLREDDLMKETLKRLYETEANGLTYTVYLKEKFFVDGTIYTSVYVVVEGEGVSFYAVSCKDNWTGDRWESVESFVEFLKNLRITTLFEEMERANTAYAAD